MKFANFIYICITDGFVSSVIGFPACNGNIYKICKLHRAIFSLIYKISPPNFAITLV